MLPLLTIGIIFAVFAIFELASYISSLTPKKMKNVVKFVLIIAGVALISFQYFSIADPLVAGKSGSYAGHVEAGQWLKENMNGEAILFAGSPRMMRAFTEKEFYNQGPDDSPISGGPVRWLRGERYHENYQNWDYNEVVNPDARINFEEDVVNLTKSHDLFIEIDIWEFTQPRWYFPIKQESINYFIGQGFSLVHIIEREVQTQNGLQKMPVIFIFKKEREI